MAVADAMVPCRSRCGAAGAENNCNAKRNFPLAQHFRVSCGPLGWRIFASRRTGRR